MYLMYGLSALYLIGVLVPTRVGLVKFYLHQIIAITIFMIVLHVIKDFSAPVVLGWVIVYFTCLLVMFLRYRGGKYR